MVPGVRSSIKAAEVAVVVNAAIVEVDVTAECVVVAVGATVVAFPLAVFLVFVGDTFQILFVFLLLLQDQDHS